MKMNLIQMPGKLSALMATVALFSSLTALPAAAAFPDKPVHIIVPFAPGGGTDMISRLVGDGMSHELGQPVIVENKPGAGTTIGMDHVAKSAPDGYSLVMATFAHAINPSLLPKLPYDTNTAFAPVILIGHSPSVLVVKPNSPYKTIKDVIDAAKANPKKLTYASQGVGTSAHLSGELLESLAKVDMTHVPYRGAGPALNDLLGGHVDMMFGTAAAVASHLNAGTLRALGVTTAERSPALANVPTLAESGVPGYVLDSWYGLYAPAGTPADVIERLNAAAKKAVRTESFRQKVQNEGLVITAGTPEQFAQYINAEQARWAKVIKENHITVN